MSKIRIILVGIGGYGEKHVKDLLDENNSDKLKDVEIIAVVEPNLERCNNIEELKEKNIAFYSSLEEYYGCHSKGADLAIITTPIYLHASQIIYCLSKGTNVLCEKPLCASYEEAVAIIKAEKSYGKSVGIGYQLSFSRTIQELKKDIQSGIFGKAIRLKTIIYEPRGEKYYSRNSWVGKINTADNRSVLDSPINNAFAHQLHNMFYILGKTRESSAIPVEVTAELYKANLKIENFDTATLKCITQEGVEILFYSSHTIKKYKWDCYKYEFENAIIEYIPQEMKSFVAKFKDGTEKRYQSCKEKNSQKLWDAIENVRTGKPMACGALAACSQTLCIIGVQEALPDVVSFPSELIEKTGEVGDLMINVLGLEDKLHKCFDEDKLPSELETPYVKRSKIIKLKSINY